MSTTAAQTKTTWIWGTGRRKTAVARVRLCDGSGLFTVNGRPLDGFFCEERDRKIAQDALILTDMLGKVDIHCNVDGGGFAGQAAAVLLGVARALKKLNPGFDVVLRKSGFLTRDSRMKERKKYGLAAARKRFQFSKR